MQSKHVVKDIKVRDVTLVDYEQSSWGLLLPPILITANTLICSYSLSMSSLHCFQANHPGKAAMRFIYLHGFASGPQSGKAQFFFRQFSERGVTLEIPNLVEGDFEDLTITDQLGVLERLTKGEPVSLIGSSMGGYLAALYASRHPEAQKLALLAPAFQFVQRWPEEIGPYRAARWESTGRFEVFHYGEGRPETSAGT